MPTLKKRWGQHHLRHAARCRPLLDFLRPAGQRVFEIGAGGGVLTAELAAEAAHVVACDLDLDWLAFLRRQPAMSEVGLVAADALRLVWEALPAGTLVTGNLPFNVGTPVIEGLLRRGHGVPRAAFMVQREVAERLVATPGDRAYGALSVLMALRAEACYLGTVPAAAFRPPPKVDAAFVGLTRRPPPVEVDRVKALEALIRMAFAVRRKTLRNALASGWGRPRADAVLAAAAIDPRVRAERLDLASFVALLEASEVDGGPS